MHIPDGFLDLPTAIAAGAAAVAGIALGLRDVRRNLSPRRVPLIGLAAAFVFATQMLNFPIAAGTSGHMTGAVLAVVLLGPGAAVIVMTAVLVLQCFMFADGGVTALGANVLNMAIIAPAVGYVVYAGLRRLCGDGQRSLLFAAGFAAWCATVAAALACAVELAASGTVVLRSAVMAMGGVHMVVGLVEAAITMMVVAVVIRSRPELLDRSQRVEHGVPATVAFGAVATIGVLVFVSPLASPLPDGLEHVAHKLGFAAEAATPIAAPLQDYAVKGLVDQPWLGTVVAAGVGVAAAFAMAWLMARMLTRHALHARR